MTSDARRTDPERIAPQEFDQVHRRNRLFDKYLRLLLKQGNPFMRDHITTFCPHAAIRAPVTSSSDHPFTADTRQEKVVATRVGAAR
jgi:hypothetical protein